MQTNADIRKRLGWIRLYERTRNAGLTCLRCGISRPTLRKWVRRYQALGEEGLRSQSRRPRSFPGLKRTEHVEFLIQGMRRQRRLGPRRIQSELLRLYQIKLARATIQKALKRSGAKPLIRSRRHTRNRRYSAGIPGARVQLDTIKIAPGLFQYTAVDDCTRWLVAGLFKQRSAANTLAFLEQLVEEFPYPIQRVQTDNGREFTAYPVTDRLMEWGIRWRPIRPGAPHLNGKVERAQKTLLEEFYAVTDLGAADLADELGAYVTYYNYMRDHGSLGTTPAMRGSELGPITPLSEDVYARFDPARERQYHLQRARKSQVAPLK